MTAGAGSDTPPDVRADRRFLEGRLLRRVAALAVACALPACAPRFDGRVYRGEGFAFRVPPIPAGWQPVDHSHAALAFHDAEHDGLVLFNGRCGQDGDDVPLLALKNHLFLQFTERSEALEEVVPFDGREAMHTVLVAKLDGVPLKYDVWVLKKDGCVYDLLYGAPEGRFEQGQRVFLSVVAQFATVRPDGD